MAIKNYKVGNVPVDRLKFDESNPNKMSEDQIEALYKAMKRFGYLVPIIINSKYEIADGEHRAQVYKDMGIKEIPAYMVPSLDNDIERRLLRQTMNKLRGEHDETLDVEELKVIYDDAKLGDLASLIAQDQQDLERVIQRENGTNDIGVMDEGEALKEVSKKKPRTKVGDVWECGNHIVVCADSITNKLQIGKPPDLVFIDPPYNINFHYKDFKDNKKEHDYLDFIRATIDHYSKIGSNMIVTPGPRNIGIWENILKPTDIGTWKEPNSRSGASAFHFRRCEPILFYGKFKKRTDDYFEHSSDVGQELRGVEEQVGVTKDNHAPAKPLSLIIELFQIYTKENDMVLDPFLGSGTSLIACEKSNRRCYGIDIDPTYIDVCVLRWERLTGKKAKKV